MSGMRTEETVIPAAEWITVLKPLLEEGHLLKICPSGRSMTPLLVGGRDEVILASAYSILKRGDIVLFSRDDGMLILHRVHHIRNGQYYMLGDAQTFIEGPVERQSIHAVAVSVIRKGREIPCSSFLSRRYAQLWLLLRPFRPFVYRAALYLHRHFKPVRK